jgi:hypothetical protein
MFVRPHLSENSLYAGEGPVDHPNPHTFFQIGVWGRRNATVHQDFDGVNLFVRNGSRSSIVVKYPHYALRLHYLKPGMVIHESVDEEVAREKGKVYSLLAILSPTPTLD